MRHNLPKVYFHSIQYVFKSFIMEKYRDKLGVRAEVETAQRYVLTHVLKGSY